MLERFLTLAADEPDAAALIDGVSGAVTTRAGLLARAEELTAQFDVSEGEILAVRMPNSVDFVAAFLAAMKLRAVFAPIDRDATESEVASIKSHFGQTPPFPRTARLLKLTSGSTGMPKAIVWSETNIAADCASICSTMGIAPTDINLGAIPFSHSYGFSNLVTPLLMQGTPVVISNDYLPLSLLEIANRNRCTVAPLIPMVFEHLASLPENDGRFETVRTFLSAGAPLPASTSRRFRERFGVAIHSFYGCSETGGITYDREGAAAERGTVGKAMDNVTLEISNERLSIRSGSVALGTLLDAQTFVPLDGVFVADDLVERNEDGEIVLVGRAGDLINTAGKKVNPREVEQVILQIDGVRDAKVYGEPAGARGEVVAAAVVADAGVTREQVRQACRERLSSHKVPRIVKLIERIPVDERGKVKRAALAALQ